MIEDELTGKVEHEIQHIVQSTKTLVKATVGASILAALVLTVAILPAEYNIDPTGLGKTFGLTKLANAVAPIKTAQAATEEYQENTVDIIIPAGAGVEYKFDVKKSKKLQYSWQSDGENLYFDFHGEPQGDTTGYYETYTASTSNSAQGTLTTPFNGNHGWYWENKSSEPIVITLITEGDYILIGKK